MNGVAAALGRNRDTPVENQSHAGGVSGSRWRLTTVSRSRPNASSSVVSELRPFAKRSDSDMDAHARVPSTCACPVRTPVIA